MAKTQKWMKVDRLLHAAWNPRTKEELDWGHPEMVPLIASVKSVGVVQPIAVWADPAAIEEADGGLDVVDGIVIAGNRRLEAARAAGLKEIPALVFTEISSAQAQEITRLENEVRLGVDPLKDASLIGSMLGLGYTQKEIAAHFGVPEARICRRRKLLELTPKIRALADAGECNITVDALERIAVYPPEIQEACAKDIVNRAKQSATALRWRDVSWYVSQRTKDLQLARFDTKDCKSCTNRTGAMPDLFGETKTDTLGRCLGVDCFCRKVREDAVGKLRKKHGSVEMVDGPEAGIKDKYTIMHDSAFGDKKTKTRPALWYWIDSFGESYTFFGPTAAQWKKLAKSRKEEQKKAMEKATRSDAAAKEKDDARKKILDERDALDSAKEAAIGAVAKKAWDKVDYRQRADSSAGVKLLDNALRTCVRDTAQRSAIARLLVSCFDTGVGLDEEVVAFCGAFPDFAKKCGITNAEFVAITQARAALDEFYKEHPDLKS